MNAIGPNINVLLFRSITLGPRLLFVLPAGDKSRDCAGGQAWAIGSEQGAERLVEAASADDFELEPGDQFVECFGAAQVRRNNFTGEWFTFTFRSTVVNTRH